ncbi:MMPL family transporter [Leifsonia aquatica]|uniref:MMPL family transporter n=1 Tax=Leifsonia aquatica TaxID=144185 RepID=UPI00046A8FD9|nr:MMPL family transporter [Leifsonia aquatica]
MASFLYALGRIAFRRRRRVLALWLLVAVLIGAGGALLSHGTDNTFTIPGTESQEALDALARTFPQVSGASAQLIAVAPPGERVDDPAFESAVEQTVTAIGRIPQVTSASSPYSGPSTGNVSADGSAALVPIQLAVATTAVLPSTADALQQAGRDLEKQLPAGSQVAVGGQVFSSSPAGISVTELLGILIAFVVLLFTFASVVAAGMPLITALLGSLISLSLIFAATHWLTIASTTPLLALMLGLAVGIDYALFIISRHQEQVKHGMDPEESAARAVATAGSAVVFAAVTVIIALVGLAVANIPFLTTMGVAAAGGVAIAVLLSTTLTPALLGFGGMRVVAKRYRAGGAPTARAAKPARKTRRARTHRPRAEHPVALGWVRGITRWPLVTVLAVVVLLGVATVPAASLRLSLPDAGSLDEQEPARITYDLIAEHFGPGYNGPLIVTGSVIGSSDPVGLMNDLAAELRTVPGVAAVPLATPNPDGDTGIAQVVPTGAPDSEQTQELVATLRSMHDHFEKEYGIDTAVTGYTAAGIDISERLGGALLPFALLVVGLSLVLLAMVFRSIVVPVTAALGYLLSIGTAFGVTSLVFMSGWLAGPLHVAHLGSIISFMPIILMGVLFGLAMDYEVFLASRMREEHVRGAAPTAAVHGGFVGSARVVTAAAAIMFAVFAAFIPEGDASIQPIALGLAVGVVVDAFIVRMTLIPAVLVLAGRAAWWMPRGLDRVLPHFDIEGDALQRGLEAADWPEPGDRIAIAAEHAQLGAHGRTVVTVDALVPAGDVLLVREEDPVALGAALYGIAGRGPMNGGRLKVAGLVLPVRRSAVRARVGVARVGDGADPIAAVRIALSGAPRILVVDGADRTAGEAAHAELAVALDRAWTDARDAGRPLTLVLGGGPAADLNALAPLGAVQHVTPPGAPPPEPSAGSAPPIQEPEPQP